MDEGVQDRILKFVEELRKKLDFVLDLLDEDLLRFQRFLKGPPYKIEKLASLLNFLSIELRCLRTKPKGPLIDLLSNRHAPRGQRHHKEEGTGIASAMQKAFRDLLPILSLVPSFCRLFHYGRSVLLCQFNFRKSKEVKITLRPKQNSQTLNQVMRDLPRHMEFPTRPERHRSCTESLPGGTGNQVRFSMFTLRSMVFVDAGEDNSEFLQLSKEWVQDRQGWIEGTGRHGIGLNY